MDDKHELREAWSAAKPPDGFADRVVAALAAERNNGSSSSSPRSTWRWGAVAVAVAATVIVVMAGRAGPTMPGASGSLQASERSTVRLAHRGVLVAEPGAQVAWRVKSRGTTRVEQPAGDVFYRVDRPGPFEVVTPGGTVQVTGTCFSVEVKPMKPSKQTMTGAAVGAALAATLVITVYEGRVLLARKDGNKVQASAGETIVSRPGYPAAVAATRGQSGESAAGIAAAPPKDVTREQLLARDEAQRKELAALRAKLASSKRDLAAARKVVRQGGPDEGSDVDPDGRPWFDPSKDTLLQMAKSCQVRYDTPPFLGNKPVQVAPDRGSELGLGETDVAVVNDTLRALHAEVSKQLRKLYVEATGDAQGAESLSPQSMITELRDKSAKGELGRIQQRIAQERAGLIPVATDVSKMSPLERYFRLLGALGDKTEHALAAKIGGQKARLLREKLGGWGRRMDFEGCPDSGNQRMRVRERD